MDEQGKPKRRTTGSVAEILGPELTAELGLPKTQHASSPEDNTLDAIAATQEPQAGFPEANEEPYEEDGAGVAESPEQSAGEPEAPPVAFPPSGLGSGPVAVPVALSPPGSGQQTPAPFNVAELTDEAPPSGVTRASGAPLPPLPGNIGNLGPIPTVAPAPLPPESDGRDAGFSLPESPSDMDAQGFETSDEPDDAFDTPLEGAWPAGTEEHDAPQEADFTFPVSMSEVEAPSEQADEFSMVDNETPAAFHSVPHGAGQEQGFPDTAPPGHLQSAEGSSGRLGERLASMSTPALAAVALVLFVAIVVPWFFVGGGTQQPEMRVLFLADSLPLMGGPGSADLYDEVAQLELNESVEALRTFGEWVLVRDPVGRAGYLRVEHLRPDRQALSPDRPFARCQRRLTETDTAPCHQRAAVQLASCQVFCKQGGQASCVQACQQRHDACADDCNALPVASAKKTTVAPPAPAAVQPDPMATDLSLAGGTGVDELASAKEPPARVSRKANKKKKKRKRATKKRRRKRPAPMAIPGPEPE